MASAVNTARAIFSTAITSFRLESWPVGGQVEDESRRRERRADVRPRIAAGEREPVIGDDDPQDILDQLQGERGGDAPVRAPAEGDERLVVVDLGPALGAEGARLVPVPRVAVHQVRADEDLVAGR